MAGWMTYEHTVAAGLEKTLPRRAYDVIVIVCPASPYSMTLPIHRLCLPVWSYGGSSFKLSLLPVTWVTQRCPSMVSQSVVCFTVVVQSAEFSCIGPTGQSTLEGGAGGGFKNTVPVANSGD